MTKSLLEAQHKGETPSLNDCAFEPGAVNVVQNKAGQGMSNLEGDKENVALGGEAGVAKARAIEEAESEVKRALAHAKAMLSSVFAEPA